MSKIKPGNKQNSFLNREYAAHVRRFRKKLTAKRRRQLQIRIIRLNINSL